MIYLYDHISEALPSSGDLNSITASPDPHPSSFNYIKFIRSHHRSTNTQKQIQQHGLELYLKTSPYQHPYSVNSINFLRSHCNTRLLNPHLKKIQQHGVKLPLKTSPYQHNQSSFNSINVLRSQCNTLSLNPSENSTAWAQVTS